MRRFLSLVLVASALVVIAAGAAVASDFRIEDETSCRALGATWYSDSQTCTLSIGFFITSGNSITVAAGVNVENQGGGTIQSGGELVIEEGATVRTIWTGSVDVQEGGALINRGTLTNDNYLLVRGDVDNFGTVINNGPIEYGIELWSTGTWSSCGIYTGDPIKNIGGTIDADCPLDDITPPVLTLPPSQSAEATGPGGAAVTYEASATDDVDPDPVVDCSPASGSEFSLGATTVNCTATDDAGNSSSGSFTVTVVEATVPTPEEQIDDLDDDVQDLLGSGDLTFDQAQGLIDKLDAATEKLNLGEPGKAIKKLTDFIKKVGKLEGKGDLSPREALDLITAAQEAINAIEAGG